MILPLALYILIKDPKFPPPVVRQVVSVQVPVAVPTPSTVPAPTVTAEDNPNHCTDTQWIASEPPFYCIEKGYSDSPSSPSALVSTNYSNTYDFHSCTWWVKYNRPNIPNTWGDATNWLYNAQAEGYATGLIPRVGAVGWVYGHVVYVFSVSGSIITIGDGNYDYNGSYRVREANASDYTYIY